MNFHAPHVDGNSHPMWPSVLVRNFHRRTQKCEFCVGLTNECCAFWNTRNTRLQLATCFLEFEYILLCKYSGVYLYLCEFIPRYSLLHNLQHICHLNIIKNISTYAVKTKISHGGEERWNRLSFVHWMNKILYVIYLTVVRTTSNLPVPHRKFSSLLFFDWNLTYPGWKLYFDRRGLRRPLTEKFNFHRVEKR